MRRNFVKASWIHAPELDATYVGSCEDNRCERLHCWVHDDDLDLACPEATPYPVEEWR